MPTAPERMAVEMISQRSAPLRTKQHPCFTFFSENRRAATLFHARE